MTDTPLIAAPVGGRRAAGTAYERVVDQLRAHGSKVRETGSRATAQCPSHEDRQASLSLRGIDGQTLMHCHAGCDTREVLTALGLELADLFDERKGAIYRYDDGRVVRRTPEKRFYQSGNTSGPAQLYHLSRLQAAADGGVFLVEGEKDVHAIESAGGIATTAPMGAKSFGKVDVTPLRGRAVTVVVDRDGAGGQWAADVRTALHGAAGRVRFVQAAAGKDAADHIAAADEGQELKGWQPYQWPAGPEEPPAEQAAPPARQVRLRSAASIKPRRVRWLWDSRVPVGEITLVAGREGAGKSTFLAWMARAITRGELPGEFHGQPRAVLYAAAEDSWAYTVVPRLIAAGANLDMVYRVDVHDAEHGQAKMTLPLDTGDVMAAGMEVDAAVLMLDPGLSFLDDKIDTYRTPEVRPALEALRRHAERHGLSVIMLCHFNKGQGTDVLTKIAGSRAFAEVARAALAVAVDDSDDEDDDQDQAAERTVILSQAKNNLGRSNHPNLTYVIRDTIVETDDDGDAHVGRLQWIGETDRTAEQALNGVKGRKPKQGGTAEAVAEWVRSKFRPVEAAEVEAAFKDIKPVTVRSTLRRLVERGNLDSPVRGYYSGPATKPSATSATSATTPAQSVCEREGESATSATTKITDVAEVALVAGPRGGATATTAVPDPDDDFWTATLSEPPPDGDW